MYALSVCNVKPLSGISFTGTLSVTVIDLVVMVDLMRISLRQAINL